jgi:Restriction endonuclease PvuII
MKPHDDYAKLLKLWPHVREFQELATRHGIKDVFQDNGGKLLQMLLITGLAGMRAREGNDAKDIEGKEFELKSVNIDLTTQVSTHHHLNPTIIAKYRKVTWVFAVYRSIELQEIWVVEPLQLEAWFKEQERRWYEKKKDINNPKIPLSLVRRVGNRFFPFPQSGGIPSEELKAAEDAAKYIVEEMKFPDTDQPRAGN